MRIVARSRVDVLGERHDGYVDVAVDGGGGRKLVDEVFRRGLNCGQLAVLGIEPVTSRTKATRRRAAPHDVGDVELIRTVLMPKISMNTVWTTAFPVTVTLEPPWVV